MEFVLLYFGSEEKAYRDKGRFFYGESMGAAVAVLVHRKDPSFWNGGVLVAPMCKVICYNFGNYL